MGSCLSCFEKTYGQTECPYCQTINLSNISDVFRNNEKLSHKNLWVKLKDFLTSGRNRIVYGYEYISKLVMQLTTPYLRER